MYKVCIKAAGRGSRNRYAQRANKALLPVDGMAAMSRIINKFSAEVEVVIPVGHNAQLIKDFVSIAHSDRKIVFVDVDRYEGKGSGPGYSLLCCKDMLQCPFVFFACDTLVSEDVPEPTENWIGVASVPQSKDYLVAEVVDGGVTRLFDKADEDTLLKAGVDCDQIRKSAFIGLAAVRDYEAFWDGLENDTTLVKGELQVANGLNTLIDGGLSTREFTWFDIGTDLRYEQAKQQLDSNPALPKPDEFIYFQNDYVIKYFADSTRAGNRVERAELLRGAVPEVEKSTDNFYAYRFLPARTIGQITDVSMFRRFLDFCQTHLWQRVELSDCDRQKFRMACQEFYWNKTHKRLDMFCKQTEIADRANTINGDLVPGASELLDMVDWELLFDGIAVRFHGDPQPENVLVTDAGRFCLIDWREDFAGILEYGDIYYDFAKIYHALLVSHEVIQKEEYRVHAENGHVEFNFMVKNNLLDFTEVFESFIEECGFDLYKVRLLSALIYTNICPLHHHPYNLLLYYLGRYTLFNVLNEYDGINNRTDRVIPSGKGCYCE